MSEKTLGDRLKHLAHVFTEEDPEPRTDATAGRLAGPRARRTKSVQSKAELYADAKRLGIKGRSKMTKEQLARAIRRA